MKVTTEYENMKKEVWRLMDASDGSSLQMAHILSNMIIAERLNAVADGLNTIIDIMEGDWNGN